MVDETTTEERPASPIEEIVLNLAKSYQIPFQVVLGIDPKEKAIEVTLISSSKIENEK